MATVRTENIEDLIDQLNDEDRELFEAADEEDLFLRFDDMEELTEEISRVRDDHLQAVVYDFDEWAQDLANECFDLDDDVSRYFDYEQWAYDLEMQYMVNRQNGKIYIFDE